MCVTSVIYLNIFLFFLVIIAPNKLQDERITYREYKALAEAKFDRLEADFELHFRAIVDALMEAELRTCYASDVIRSHLKNFW